MKLFTYFLLIISFTHSFSQDLEYYKKQVDTLCSRTMYGRGYLKNGHRVAAKYLELEFKKLGYSVIQQKFGMIANTFPRAENMIINDSIVLKVGEDFIPSPVSSSLEGNFQLFTIDSTFIDSLELQQDFLSADLNSTILVHHQNLSESINQLSDSLKLKMNTSPGIITLTEGPLMGSFYPAEAHKLMIDLLATSLPDSAQTISLAITNKLASLQSQNVIASPKHFNKKWPTIVITGHYDHLGGYGDSCFVSGANDNASGIAMILDMAKKYSRIYVQANFVFIAFGGEEAGLLGSSHFVEYPKIPLEEIDLVLNFDLMGAGSKGFMVENGDELHKVYNAFVETNEKLCLLPEIKKRANSANSDHYPFTQKGVDAVFIYSLGDVGGYHNVLDSKENLEYDSYTPLYKTITQTIEQQIINLK